MPSILDKAFRENDYKDCSSSRTKRSTAWKSQSGLTAEQVTTFLSMLEQKIADGEAWQEQNLRKRQEALAKVSEAEYYRVKLIYKEMQNLAERQTWCYQYTRERLMSILERND